MEVEEEQRRSWSSSQMENRMTTLTCSRSLRTVRRMVSPDMQLLYVLPSFSLLHFLSCFFAVILIRCPFSYWNYVTYFKIGHWGHIQLLTPVKRSQRFHPYLLSLRFEMLSWLLGRNPSCLSSLQTDWLLSFFLTTGTGLLQPQRHQPRSFP